MMDKAKKIGKVVLEWTIVLIVAALMLLCAQRT